MTLIFFRDGWKSLESFKYNNYTVYGLENCLFLAESKFFNNCIFVSIIVQQRDGHLPDTFFVFLHFFGGISTIIAFAIQFLFLLYNSLYLLYNSLYLLYNSLYCWNTITSVAIQHDDIYLLYIVLFFLSVKKKNKKRRMKKKVWKNN